MYGTPIHTKQRNTPPYPWAQRSREIRLLSNFPEDVRHHSCPPTRHGTPVPPCVTVQNNAREIERLILLSIIDSKLLYATASCAATAAMLVSCGSPSFSSLWTCSDCSFEPRRAGIKSACGDVRRVTTESRMAVLTQLNVKSESVSHIMRRCNSSGKNCKAA